MEKLLEALLAYFGAKTLEQLYDSHIGVTMDTVTLSV